MCRNCGAIVGSGQLQCAVCGNAVSGPTDSRRQSAPTPDNETLRFARAVLNRPYKFTLVLLAVNVFFFTLMWQISGMSFSLLNPLPDPVLIAFGAKVNSFIQTQHQWWRFVTPMFLHVNVLHLLVNMYSLWIVGPYVEKLYGSAKFVVFWVLTGIAGVVASYLTVRPSLATSFVARFVFKAVDTPSAGASGALFGLVGVLFVFGIKFRHELPEGFKRAFGTGLLPMIFLNLFIGFVGSGFIDNAAHLGGFFSGAVLALLVDYRRPGEKSGVALIWRVLQVSALVLVAVSFVKIAQHLRDPLPASLDVAQAAADTSTPENRAFLLYAQATSEALEAFVVAVKDKNPSNIDAAVLKLDQAPHLDQQTKELKDKLKALLLRAKEPRPTATPAREKGKPTEADPLIADMSAWTKEYNQWLKTAGRTYSGLSEVVPDGTTR
jgi:rhomboid protease GluP